MTAAPESFAWTVEWANENASPVAKLMGFKVLEVSPGSVVVAMDYRPTHLELMGVYNAGVLVSLADAACVFAARTVTDPAVTVDPDRYPLVVQISMNLMHNASHGRVTAHARVIHGGHTTQVVEAELRDETGRLIGKVTTTHVTVPRYSTAVGPITE